MEIDRQGCSDEVPGRTVDSPLPEHYNIAVDVCGRWAEDRSRFALYYPDVNTPYAYFLLFRRVSILSL
jgi:hypothetical protein